MKMKRVIAVGLTAAMLAGTVLTGCGGGDDSVAETAERTCLCSSLRTTTSLLSIKI